MQLRRAVSFFTLTVFFLVASLMSAQSPTTGQIAGVVKDPSGAVISSANVTLTSTAGVQRTALSDAAGHYAFSLVPPGTYSLEAEKAGFGKETAEGVVVRITEITSFDIHLQVASQKAV
ncbi:MAG: carboxypeptidase-like regulatory domain-containing protein, partial [Candidatus Sulfotelmatobacter sp.]